MSLKDTVTSMETHLTDAYNTLEEKGATLPENKNLENLSAAIESVSGGGGGGEPDEYLSLSFTVKTSTASATTKYYDSPSTEVNAGRIFMGLSQPTSSSQTMKTPFMSLKSGEAISYSTNSVGDGVLSSKIEKIYVNLNGKTFTGRALGSYFSGLRSVIIENCTQLNNILEYAGAKDEFKELKLPDNLTTISSSFCSNSKFCGPLSLPATLNSIYYSFMHNCNDFTGPLYIPAGVTPPTDTSYSPLSTTTATAPMYVNGVTLYGPGAQAWITALPNRDASPYRKLIYGGESMPGQPDKPVESTLSNLKSALDTGNAATLFPVGTEIIDKWNGVDDPWLVGNYQEVTLSDGTKKQAVALVRKYIDANYQFGQAGNANYGQSMINTYLQGAYLDSCSDDIKNLISEVQITYHNYRDYQTVNTKFFLLSANEVMDQGRANNIFEGEPWQLFKNLTGLSTMDAPGTNNSGRVAYMANNHTQAQHWWLRSVQNASYPYVVNTTGAVSGANSNGSYGVRPGCFIIKD